MNILVIEDEMAVGSAIKRSLKQRDFVNIVELVDRFHLAIEKVCSGIFDIILVDLFLSSDEHTGLDICDEIRKKGIDVPIIIVTGSYSLSFMERAFDLGVNDYITKPFNMKELELRVKRWGGVSLPVRKHRKIEYNELSYCPSKNQFYYKGCFLQLTKKQKILLLIFLKKPEKLISKDLLEEKIWGNNYCAFKNRNLRSNIQYLRQSLEKRSINWLHTVRGEGYILKKGHNMP